MLRPLADKLIVKVVAKEEITRGGIVLPGTAQEKPQEAVVVAVGPGRVLDNGQKVLSELKANDRVVFAKYSGSEFKYEGEDYLILSERDILAVVE